MKSLNLPHLERKNILKMLTTLLFFFWITAVDLCHAPVDLCPAHASSVSTPALSSLMCLTYFIFLHYIVHILTNLSWHHIHAPPFFSITITAASHRSCNRCSCDSFDCIQQKHKVVLATNKSKRLQLQERKAGTTMSLLLYFDVP